MRESDFDRFDALMQGVADNYGQTLTAQGVAMRFKILQQHDFASVQHAAMAILTSRKYTTMPTIADFIEHIGGGSAEDLAEIEAAKVLDAIKHIGSYRSVAFDDPTTQAVITQAYGGWASLCRDCGITETEHWFRKNFAKTWAAYKRQGVVRYGTLPGVHEIENGDRGFKNADKVHLVGDHHKALDVAKRKEDNPQIVMLEIASNGDLPF